LQEIERAIDGLPRGDFFRLVRHIRLRHADAWDRQIEEDASSGRLHELYDRLREQDRGEPEAPLADFLNDEKLP
jgi:hypothetical protein